MFPSAGSGPQKVHQDGVAKLEEQAQKLGFMDYENLLRPILDEDARIRDERKAVSDCTRRVGWNMNALIPRGSPPTLGRGSSSSKATSDLLGLPERIFAGLLGFAILGWASDLIFDPPSHKQALTGCTVSATQSCIGTVSEVPEAVLVALITAAAALLLIAVLGVRFRSVKAGPIELAAKVEASSPASAERAAADGKVQPVAPEPIRPAVWDQTLVEPDAMPVVLAAQRDQTALWASLPPAVQQSIIEAWRLAKSEGTPWESIVQVYAPTTGNNEWFVKFADETTWRARLEP
jgi:hypothetical protein